MEVVSGVQVIGKMVENIDVLCIVCKYNVVSFEKLVGFVSRKEKLKRIWFGQDRGPFGDLGRVLESFVVWECYFPEAHERKESNGDLGDEQEVVVIR